MARRPDLFDKSRALADELSHLLNRTVCTGVRLTAAVVPHKGVVVVGYGVSRHRLTTDRGVPLSLGAKQPSCYLGVSIRLGSTSPADHLMVLQSALILSRDERLEQVLLHYDYERDKGDGYPEAHLQVCATSVAWESLGGDRALEKLHLPVGGRRYRPTLEDLVEFLVVESLADGHDNWHEAVDLGRARFQEVQLRAAIRRHPDVAREVLGEMFAQQRIIRR